VSRLPDAFAAARREGRAALVTYLMAGDPDLRRTEDFARACEQGGADVIELGVPFSDPIADGPEIQRAGQRSLHAGTRLRDVLGLAASVRRRSEIPLVLMSYANPLYAMGLETFAEQARDAGVDGLIVPDLSWEDSEPWTHADWTAFSLWPLRPRSSAQPQSRNRRGASSTWFRDSGPPAIRPTSRTVFRRGFRTCIE